MSEGVSVVPILSAQHLGTSAPVVHASSRARRRWSRARRMGAFSVAVAMFCVAIMLIETILPEPTALSGNSGLRAAETPDVSAPLDFPFAVSPSLYPDPSNLSSSLPTSLTKLVSLPSSPSSFGLLNASGNASTADRLWFSVGSYSPTDAEAIARGWSCAAGSLSKGDCEATPTVPIAWATAGIANLSAPVTADALAFDGADLYAAATSSGHTSLFTSVNGGATWSTVASGLSGSVTSVDVTPVTETLLTVSGTHVVSTSFDTEGAELGATTLRPAGSGITGIAGAALAVAPEGGAWRYVAAVGVQGPNEIEVATSSDGVHYSSWASVAPFNVTVPNPALSSIGETELYPAGGTPGQVALTSDGSGFFLLFTSRVEGAVEAETLASATGTSGWSGPDLVGSGVGAVESPTVTAAPTGDVYAAWQTGANGSASVVESTFAPSGGVEETPTPLPGSSSLGLAPNGAPALAVDSFDRPLLVWPAAPSASREGTLAFSGAFLDAPNANSLLDTEVNDPLVDADFTAAAQSGESSPVTTLEDDVGSDTGSVSTNLTVTSSPGSSNATAETAYCDAQNETVETLYPTVTVIPLSIESSGTTCSTFSSSKIRGLGESTLAPLIGPDAPNTYLAVYTGWLLESEGVELGASPLTASAAAPPPSSSGFTATPANFGLPLAVSGNGSIDGSSQTVTVTPTVYSPTAAELSVTSTSPPEFVSSSEVYCFVDVDDRLEKEGGRITVVDTDPAKAWMNVTVNNGSTYSRSTGSGVPSSLFLTNLSSVSPPSDPIYWAASFAVAYLQTTTITTLANGCGWTAGTTTSTAYGGTLGPIDEAGGFWTELAIQPDSPSSDLLTVDADTDAVTVDWVNTMEGTETAALVNDSTDFGSQSWSDPGTYSAAPGSYEFPLPAQQGDAYTATVTAVSLPGGWLAGESPADSIGTTNGEPSASEQATDSCSFTLSPPSETLTTNSGVVSDVTATTANVSWSATAASAVTPGTGFLTYYAVGTGLNETDYAVAPVDFGTSGGETTYDYEAELHGLSPWTFYHFAYGILASPTGGAACYTEVESDPIPNVLTGYEFRLSEQDQPYDSITETGGGATFTWGLPAWFVDEGPTFDSGTLTYSSSAGTVTVPLSVQSLDGPGSGPNWFAITLQLGVPNTAYSANVSMSYTLDGTTYNAGSPELSFVYLQDTSGDGLTDAEKEDGWTVSVTRLDGQVSDELVGASLLDYATNGLVSDYVEKEFGLDPNTLDTAGSNMLDTWNLTFLLQNSSCPYGFGCWYEDNENPFSSSVTPGGAPGDGTPIATNSTSAAHWTSGGLQDDSSYDAEVLWTGGALGVLQNLIASERVGWLRGVIMHGYDDEWTLTVWGKLSWGADPLAQSTLNDGIVDGQQADPVATEVAQFTLTGWSSDQSSSSYEAGPFLEVTTTSSGTGTVLYDGYGPVEKGSPAKFSGTYIVSVPVHVAGQDAYYNLSINENDGASSKTLAHLLTVGSTAIDLLGTSYGSLNASNSSDSASVTGWYKVLREAEAANTLLWVPGNNTTLSSVPWGLKRYTAEPDFDLLVLNLSAATTVNGIEGAESGWSYGLTLPAGLNNLLVPRGAFMDSPLGQALINNTNETVRVPEGSGVTFTPTDWSSRTETSGSNPAGGANFIWMFSNTSQLQNGSSSGAFGGLPQNPSVESAYESRQVQAVFWINVTSAGNGKFSTGAAELDNLFGGLVLNGTGNLTGNLLDITSELGTLGLPANVMSALANVTLTNSGAYAPPKYEASSPAPSLWQAIGSAIWNTLSGIAEAVTRIVSVVWNALAAAEAYIDEAAAWLSSHLGLGKIADQLASGLKMVASAMEWALDTLLAYLRAAAAGIIDSALVPFDSLRATFAQSLNEAVDPTGPYAVWSVLGGPLFLLGYVVALAFEVVLFIIGLATLGASVLVNILVGALVGVGLTLLMAALPVLISPSTAMVSACQEYAGSFANQNTESENWTAWGDAFAYWEAGPSNEYAAIQLAVAWSNPLVGEATSFAFAILSLAMDWFADSGGGMEASVSALVLAATSLVLELASLKQPKGLTSSMGTVDLVIAGMDTFSVGWDSWEFSQGV
jgi:hypothetical protein